MSKSTYSFTVKAANGTDFPLSSLEGKTTLIVNVASKCGFTPQYDGLEALYQKYKDRNFVILGFPCNQFGAQEQGSNEEIQEFCKINFGVSFPVLAKIDVNGDQTDPLYKHLKSMAPGLLGSEAIKWNFTKFLVGKNGEVIDRFAPQTTPDELAADIEKALSPS